MLLALKLFATCLLCRDIIHPTVVGHRLISKFIAGELRKWQLLSGTTVVA